MHLHIYTYKDASKLLSTVAHDLRLSVARFTARRDGSAVEVRCQLDSLAVDGKVSGGRVEGMNLLERREILKNTRGRKVLATDKHPEARFSGRLDAGHLTGQLSFAGRTAPVECPVDESDGRVRGRLTLAPSRWGIPPFKAMMGTIALDDRIEIDFDVPAEGT